MTEPVHLHGYRYSVYNRIVRLVLISKEVEYDTIEVNPFNELSETYLGLHPFGRVPVLEHGSFKLFETGAITRYIDRAFEGQSLQPESAVALARMDQVIAVIDAYGYWPMVRQVSSNAFFRSHFGEQSSRAEVEAGLNGSRIVLSFLEDVAREGEVLTGDHLTLADFYLAPMIDYFVRAEEGKAMLSTNHALQGWWDSISTSEILKITDPFANQMASN